MSPARGLYKPRVTDPSLSWWRRLWLAFGVFFRVLFDARYAASIVRVGRAPEPSAAAVPPSSPPAPAAALQDGEGALVLLSLLQSEGRFVDFVQQDIAAFPDAEVGAVARMVHGGCRKVLGAHLRIEAIRAEPEGQPIALDAGFDANRVKLTGRVGGNGRVQGVLRHRGWHVVEVKLPKVVDPGGAVVLAPAEVEL